MADADTLQILEPLFACIDDPHRIVRLMSVSKAWKSGVQIWFKGLRRLVNRWQSPLSDETLQYFVEHCPNLQIMGLLLGVPWELQEQNGLPVWEERGLLSDAGAALFGRFHMLTHLDLCASSRCGLGSVWFPLPLTVVDSILIGCGRLEFCKLPCVASAALASFHKGMSLKHLFITDVCEPTDCSIEQLAKCTSLRSLSLSLSIQWVPTRHVLDQSSDATELPLREVSSTPFVRTLESIGSGLEFFRLSLEQDSHRPPPNSAFSRLDILDACAMHCPRLEHLAISGYPRGCDGRVDGDTGHQFGFPCAAWPRQPPNAPCCMPCDPP
jgi:hypothetical protein